MKNFYDVNARDGKTFMGRGSVTMTTGNVGGVALTCAANKQLFVYRLRLVSEGISSTGFIRGTLGLMTTALAGWTNLGNAESMRSGGVSSSANISSLLAATITPTKTLYGEALRYIADPQLNIRVLDIDLEAPIVVDSGHSLTVVGDNTVAGTVLRVGFEFVEKP